jgi:translation initiation factor eIF-2B subunit delta
VILKLLKILSQNITKFSVLLLGDPDDIVDIGKSAPYLWDWRDYNSLTLLNLVFDFTPPEFVSMVITELGMIPCTSVPVVLRMRQAETNET